MVEKIPRSLCSLGMTFPELCPMYRVERAATHAGRVLRRDGFVSTVYRVAPRQGTIPTGGTMLRAAALFALSALLPSTAAATWSVIAIDMSTGRVVIASATCVNRDDAFLMGVQAVVVPGKGVAACQANVDGTHANQMLVYLELQKGTDPARIIELLAQDPAFQSRQFGILDLSGRSAGHSGLTNGYVSQDIQGRVPGTQIYYSIQGNILRPGEVVPNAVKAFLSTNGAITDRVMAAMEAADASGGDSRCTCPPPPGRQRGQPRSRAPRRRRTWRTS